MPLWFIVSTVAVTAVSSIVTRRLYQRSEARQHILIAPAQIANLRRLAWRVVNALVVVFWYVSVSILLIVGAADRAEKASDQATAVAMDAVASATENCQTIDSVQEFFANIYDSNIEETNRNIERLAAALEDPESAVEIPGFEDLPPAVQTYLRSLVRGQARESQARLDQFREDLTQFRERSTQISAIGPDSCAAA